jgi:hypothetical protein
MSKVIVRISGTTREINKQTIFSVLEIIRKRIIQDQQTKRIRSSGKSAQSLQIEEISNGGQLVGDDYFQQQITGRKPGKFPPIKPILQWIDSKGLSLNKITKNGLAYIIARKIAEKGTDIYRKKRPGLAVNEIVNQALPSLKDQLIKAGKIELKTAIAKALGKQQAQNLQTG